MNTSPVQDWPDILYYHDGSRTADIVQATFREIDRTEWYVLYRGPDGSYWRLDVWAKYQTRFLVRLKQREGWLEFDSTSLEKWLLLSNRGGCSDEKCRQAGCDLYALNGSAFCLDHTYEMGVRE